ncbi:hypothetical protein F750_0052 [Streptomyces sp. PAMC 26508]|nr:hypothetical protein F750_0052 [Streptomyces sp. PAMC 26508]
MAERGMQRFAYARPLMGLPVEILGHLGDAASDTAAGSTSSRVARPPKRGGESTSR